MPATRPNTHLSDRDGVVFESTEPERTEAFLSAAFGNRMKVSGDRDNYRFRLSRLGTGAFQVNTVDHMATIEVRADPLPAHVGVVRMHHGVRTNLDLGDRLGPGDISVVAQPDEHWHARVTTARYGAVLIPMQAVADAARNRPDEDLGPLGFDSLRPVNPAAARRWVHAVDYVAGTMRADPDAMTQPLLSGAITRLLAATLLATFPNNWVTDADSNDHTDATATTLTRAMAFIDLNADVDIGVVDVARAAYVTVRAVQLAFRRYLDTTPMEYLRRVRLERAHEQLRAAQPGDGITISEVAARWGFADPSRFAALYRRTYGQLPSQTLRS